MRRLDVPKKSTKEYSKERYAVYGRAYYQEHKEEIKARISARYILKKDSILSNARARYHGKYRDSKLARIYGVSKEEAQYWLSITACEICSASDRRMTLDHDHNKTAGIRGRLCTNCNSGIGHFKENPEVLRLAAIYLENRKEKQTI